MLKVQLIPKPYQLANGKWVPLVIKRFDTKDAIREQKIDKWDEQFDTKQKVNEFLRAEIEVMKIGGLG